MKSDSVVVAALYKFVRLEDFEDLQNPLLAFCKEHQIYGTLLLALEGINGTVAGSRESIDLLLGYLKSDPRLSDLEHKESFASEIPFIRMKVKLKKEIVTLGVEGVDPTQTVGQYLSPKEWNELLDDPEVVVVDTRNDYETQIGLFRNALDPKTKTFRQFPEWVNKELDPSKHKKVAMYCTGGIRCEKSTAFMLKQGFEEVYHLKGGILKYLEEVSPEESKWEGECFVFDERVGVKHGLEVGDYDLCRGCRYPVSEADKESIHYEEGVCCPHCWAEKSEKSKARAAERQRQIELAIARGEKHLREGCSCACS